MKRFLKLVRKDLETGRLPVLLLSGITLALMVWARLRLVNAPAVVETAESYWPSIYLVLALAVPVTFFPLWLIWRSVQTLRLEWRDDTIYTLLALPVPGWQIMLAKLVSLCMEYTVLFAVATGGALLLFGGVLNMGTALPGPSWVALNIFWLYLGGLLLFTALAVQTQLAVVVGKMVGRVQGIVTLWCGFWQFGSRAGWRSCFSPCSDGCPYCAFTNSCASMNSRLRSSGSTSRWPSGLLVSYHRDLCAHRCPL